MVRDGFLRRAQQWLWLKLIYAFFGRWGVLYIVSDSFFKPRIQWWLYHKLIYNFFGRWGVPSISLSGTSFLRRI